MKYFKAKRVITEHTTLTIEGMDVIFYDYDGVYDYCGVADVDVNSFLNSQPPEIEAEELTFQEIKPTLQFCKKMLDLDKIIEKDIAKKYSMGRELKLRDLPVNDPERIEYEEYKEICKEQIRAIKVEMGLEQE